MTTFKTIWGDMRVPDVTHANFSACCNVCNQMFSAAVPISRSTTIACSTCGQQFDVLVEMTCGTDSSDKTDRCIHGSVTRALHRKEQEEEKQNTERCIHGYRIGSWCDKCVLDKYLSLRRPAVKNDMAEGDYETPPGFPLPRDFIKDLIDGD